MFCLARKEWDFSEYFQHFLSSYTVLCWMKMKVAFKHRLTKKWEYFLCKRVNGVYVNTRHFFSLKLIYTYFLLLFKLVTYLFPFFQLSGVNVRELNEGWQFRWKMLDLHINQDCRRELLNMLWLRWTSHRGAGKPNNCSELGLNDIWMNSVYNEWFNIINDWYEPWYEPWFKAL